LGAFAEQKEGCVTLNRLTAVAVAGTILAATCASAAPLSIGMPEFVSLPEQIVLVQYNGTPPDVMGGVIGGIVGGALGGGCYFNDCGYDYGGGGYYGGGYTGGGYGGVYHGGGYHGGWGHAGAYRGGAYHGGGGHGGGSHGGGAKTH